MEIGDGKQALLPSFKPLVFFQALALWTMTVPSVVMRDPDVAAARAGVFVPAEGCCTALLDVSEYLPLPCGRIPDTAVLICVGTEYVRDLKPRPLQLPDHGRVLPEHAALRSSQEVERTLDTLDVLRADARVSCRHLDAVVAQDDLHDAQVDACLQ